jgi:hypothetical protein
LDNFGNSLLLAELNFSPVGQAKLCYGGYVARQPGSPVTKAGAEALSGMARAFFYAGARSLLVSHWAVNSYAAARLTTLTFDTLRNDPGLGRAEALRRAMLAFMEDPSAN